VDAKRRGEHVETLVEGALVADLVEREPLEGGPGFLQALARVEVGDVDEGSEHGGGAYATASVSANRRASRAACWTGVPLLGEVGDVPEQGPHRHRVEGVLPVQYRVESRCVYEHTHVR
jgi:hypothetical protein